MPRIEKKDLGYWILMLVIFIVVILTLKLGDNGSAIDYFGFAGTLVGILLAVVALIYSFYQSSVYGNTTNRLDESAKKIEEVTYNLQIVGQLETSMQAVASSLQDLSYTLPDKIEELQAILGQLNDNQFDLHQETRNEIMSALTISSKQNNISFEEDEDQVIKSTINFLTIVQFAFICYLLLIRDHNERGSHREFSVWALDHELTVWTDLWKKDKLQLLVDMSIGNCVGVQHMFTFRNYIRLSGHIEEFTVEEINEIVFKAIQERIETQNLTDLMIELNREIMDKNL